MRILIKPLLIGALLLMAACADASREAQRPSTSKSFSPAATQSQGSGQAAQPTPVPKRSTASATQADAAPAKVDSKIIRSAELVIENTDPEGSLKKVESNIESEGGFVVATEVQQQGSAPGSKIATVVVRVPAAQFEAAINKMGEVGSRIQEKRTGEDVTEEFIDLKARLDAKKALEAKFVELVKQTKNVSEALEVQRQIAEVRTKIKQLEGQQQFLENQSSYSTITVKLQPQVPSASATPGGFSNEANSAYNDFKNITLVIVLVYIRVGLALIPIVILIVLPAIFIWRFRMRLYKRRNDAQPGEAIQPANESILKSPEGTKEPQPSDSQTQPSDS
jgi:hypothetical protein